MPYKYHETVNIYNKDAIATAIKTQETNLTVVQGKVSSLITDSELTELRNGGSTMYSRMTSVEQTADGISTNVTNLTNELHGDYSTTTAMNSAITQKANEITASVNQTFTNYSTTEQMNSAITQKANQITASVNQTLTNYSTTQQMNSAITQSANSITQTVANTYYTKSAGGDIERRMTSAESKITDSAIISTVMDSSEFGATTVSKINQTASEIRIQASKIALEGAVTASMLAANSVTSTAIKAGEIKSTHIAAGQIKATHIGAGEVNATHVAAGSLTATQINVQELFSHDITATGTITGVTLVGTTADIDAGSIGSWLVDPTDGFLKNAAENPSIFLSPTGKGAVSDLFETDALAKFNDVIIDSYSNLFADNVCCDALRMRVYYGLPHSGDDPYVFDAVNVAAVWATNHRGGGAEWYYTFGVGDSFFDNYFLFDRGNCTYHAGSSSFHPGDYDVGACFNAVQYQTTRKTLAKNTNFQLLNGRMYLVAFYHAGAPSTAGGLYLLAGGSPTVIAIKSGTGINITMGNNNMTFNWSLTSTLAYDPFCTVYY